MKNLTALFLFVLFLGDGTHAQGFLKTSGQRIVNEKGENIILRGMGLGGWMLQEGYMLKLNGTNPQYSVRQRIEKLLGPGPTQEFYDAWLSNFITRADIDSMRAWGFNSVRLPMHYNLFTLPVEQEKDSTRQTWIDKGFQLTDSLLSWCKANHIYLILDLHAAPGGQGNDFNIADRDSTKPSLWDSEANQRKTIALWKKLAERYKDEPWMGAYDLLNETNWGFTNADDKHGQKETGNQPLRQLLMKITEAIRSVDKKHIVIIEGNAWGNNYKGVFPLWDNNTVISFHKYWNNNDAKSIQHMLEAREQNNAPVWVGETGENSNVWFADAVRLFEENNIGWSWWPLKKIGNNNPLEVLSNPNYASLVDYWNGKSPRAPKESNVYSGLMELALYTNIRTNRVKRDVIDALFRQPFSDKAIPFGSNIISGKDSVIKAVNFDLGRNGVAYSDKDTGNYSGSTGKRSVGNRGNVYRNDGVDIYSDPANYESYYVGNTDEGEWLQYTVECVESGTYVVSLVASGAAQGVALELDGKKIFSDINITGSNLDWKPMSLGMLSLSKGKHEIRLSMGSGGVNVREMLLKKN